MSFWFSDSFWGDDDGSDLPSPSKEEIARRQAVEAAQKVAEETKLAKFADFLASKGSPVDPKSIWIQWTTVKRRRCMSSRLDKFPADGGTVLSAVLDGEKVHAIVCGSGLSRLVCLDRYEPTKEELVAQVQPDMGLPPDHPDRSSGPEECNAYFAFWQEVANRKIAIIRSFS